MNRPDSSASQETIARLLKKYDRPGPRYTSYPTAPAWTDDFGSPELIDCLQGLRKDLDAGRPRPLSLYVHIPFCKNRCLFCGCNVVIAPKDKVSEPYLGTLEREVDLFAEQLGSGWDVIQLHLGGGTPTYLRPEQMRRMQEIITSRFPLTKDAEISIEVDPVVTTVDHLKALRELGYNRISMGLQDLDPKVQETVHRVQPAKLTGDFIQHCRDLKFDSVNVDLIYGLPYQNKESFAKTVDQVIAWGAERVAVFNYAYVPWIKPHQKKMPAEAMPTPDQKFGIFQQTTSQFREGGYEVIGLDHFAKPDDELAVARREEKLRRNFMGYTTQPESDILAFGVSSISEVNGCYAQNYSHLPQYRKAVDGGEFAAHRGVRLSADDLLRRDVIMDVMCNFALDKDRIGKRHGIDFDEYFAARSSALDELEGDGLIVQSKSRLEVTPLGQNLVRNVAMVFDAYLPDGNAGDGKQLFSRTV